MRQPTERIEYKGLVINVYQEEYTEEYDPRDHENLGRIVCWHPRYNLGDKAKLSNNRYVASSGDNNSLFETPQDFQRWWSSCGGRSGILLPVGLLDHSGLCMYIGSGSHPMDFGGWDSGQVGWTYVTSADIREEQLVKRITKHARDEALRIITNEFNEYNQWLQGEVYRWTVSENDEIVESCGGYVGDLPYVISEAKEAAESFDKGRQGVEQIMHT